MATAKEHNELIQVVFDGSKHLNHVLNDKEIEKMTVIEGRFPLTKLPVCGHCESLALWDKDILTGAIVATCRKCGTHTKRPITYSTYLASGYDVDPTGATFRGLTHKQEMAKRDILPDYGNIIGR